LAAWHYKSGRGFGGWLASGIGLMVISGSSSSSWISGVGTAPGCEMGDSSIETHRDSQITKPYLLNEDPDARDDE
jgi:hypothetical protein